MSVTDWDYQNKGEIQIGRDGVARCRDTLIVRVSSPTDSLTVLRRDLAQFQRWQRHPTEPGLYVEEFQAKQKPNGYWWEAVVAYSDALIVDPLEIPAKIGEVKTFKLDAATILEWDNTPILNTAGDPPEPFSRPEQIVVYVIKRNIPDLQDWLFNFESCINEDSFRLGSFNCPPKTALINSIQISDENDQGDKPYRTATLEVWRRKNKWLEVFPSRGFNELAEVPDQVINENGVGSGFTKKTKIVKRPILGPDGQPIDKPQFLDREGKWIKDPTPDQIVILTKQLYPAIPFSQLPLK